MHLWHQNRDSEISENVQNSKPRFLYISVACRCTTFSMVVELGLSLLNQSHRVARGRARRTQQVANIFHWTISYGNSSGSRKTLRSTTHVWFILLFTVWLCGYLLYKPCLTLPQEDADCCLSRHLFIGKLRECQSCECQCLFPFIFIQVPHLATTDSEFYESQPLLLYSLPKNARAWHKRKASKAKNRGCLTSSRQKTLKTPKLVRKTHLDLEIYPDAAWVFVRVKAENPGRSLRVFVSSTVFVWFMRIMSSFSFLFIVHPGTTQITTQNITKSPAILPMLW